MEQELNSKKSIAVVGAGPSGCICAKILMDNGFSPLVFEKLSALKTLLPTGGGRCNLTYSEFDFKELAKNYPRGEKFLYSVFSRFGVRDAVDFFEKIGVKTYTQDDNRIFPESNSSADVREKFLNSLEQCKFKKENVEAIERIENGYKLGTNKSEYKFNIVIMATGGRSNYFMLRRLGIPVIAPVQALVGLTTEKNFSSLAGISLKNVTGEGLAGDLLFTHKGISGPLVYKISSIYARREAPYEISLNIAGGINMQDELDKNPHKEIKNLLDQFLPKAFGVYLLDDLHIDNTIPCSKIDGQTRDKIAAALSDFKITVTGKNPEGEVVTAGGVDLRAINPATMEARNFPGLYFCGEILDIDGFCGGFNLQNCWSTGALAARSVIDSLA